MAAIITTVLFSSPTPKDKSISGTTFTLLPLLIFLLAIRVLISLDGMSNIIL